MASKVSNSVLIDRDVAEVFAFVDDYKNVTRYIVGMTEYKPLTDKTSGRGSKFSFVKKVEAPGAPDLKSKVEITQWEANKKIAFESYEGFDNGGEYSFAAASGGTRVTLTNTYDLTSVLGGGGGLFGGLKRAAGGVASKALESTVLKDLEKSLANLKKLVESTPAKAAPAKTAAKAAPAKAAAKKAPAKKAPAKKAAAKKTSTR